MSGPIPPVQDFPQELCRAGLGFYFRREPEGGFLSSLADSPFQFEGQLWPTAEHAYQAGKTSDPTIRAWLLAAPKPRHVAQAAHTLTDEDDGLVPDWHIIKFGRMEGIIQAKFEQNQDLRERLLATGARTLYEAGPTSEGVNGHANIVWGVPQDGKAHGKNALGRMLMECRGRLGGVGSPLPDFCEEAGYPRPFLLRNDLDGERHE